MYRQQLSKKGNKNNLSKINQNYYICQNIYKKKTKKLYM